MKSIGKIESAGWKFWIVLSVLLTAPITWYVYFSLYDTITRSQRIAAGLIVSMIAAAFVTVGVNEVLFRAARRRAEAERHTERKKKKRKKRGEKK